MHFVVANIVRPLTESKGVSFVTLWGGRQVDYFVPLGEDDFGLRNVIGNGLKKSGFHKNCYLSLGLQIPSKKVLNPLKTSKNTPKCLLSFGIWNPRV